MRKLLRYLGAGKREQLESDSKEITPANRVRALRAKRELNDSSSRETTAELRVRTAHEKQERDKSPATSINMDASGDAELQVSEFYTQLKRVTPYAFVTPALVVINVGVFAAMIAGGVDLMSPSIEHLLSWGPNFAPKTTGGEWWRLLASNYVHIGIIHIAFNMWVLWDAGRLVERLLGSVGFMEPHGCKRRRIGCGIRRLRVPDRGFLLLSRGSIPKKVLKGIRSSTLAFIAYNVFYAIGEESIYMAAHVGGLTAGFLCGVIMRLPLASGSAGRRWVGNGIVGGIGAAVIALVIGSGFGHVADVQ